MIMYADIFTDVEIDDIRMRKRLATEPSAVPPSGPTQRDLEQMSEREIQMAAYLATNPDPITGLPRRQAQEINRQVRERDPQMFSRYSDRDRDQNYQYDRRSDADRIYGGYTGRTTGTYNFELPSLVPNRS